MSGFDDEQFRDMMRGRRAIKPYRFPGSVDMQIGIRVLADGDISLARAEAGRWCRKHEVDQRFDPEFFEQERDRWVVLWSTVDFSTVDEAQPKPFFASIEDVRKLDTMVIDDLCKLYNEHVAWVSPVRDMDNEMLASFIEALKKGPSPEESFSGFAHSTLVRLLISMARVLRSSPTSK